MATVGAYEAKTHLPELLKRVENGESITITRHGHPVAQLVPPGAAPARDACQVIDDIMRFREGHTLGPDLTIRQLIDEGRTR